MIRLADCYPQASNIYILAICDGPSVSYGAKVSNNNQNDKADSF